MRKSVKKMMILTLSAALTAAVCSAGMTEAKKKKEKAVFDPGGTYHAALGIQTCNTQWITNMSYFEKSQNELYGTENARKLVYRDTETQEKTVADGEFEDVEIKGNGTYTVSLTGADFVGETTISQLHIATDIPLNDEVKFKDVTASVNGQKVAEFDEGYMEDEEPYLQGGMVCLVFNHWRAPLVELLEGQGLYEEESGFVLLNGNGGEDVSITFTITGFAQDNPDAVSGEDGQTAQEQDAEQAEEDNGGTDISETGEMDPDADGAADSGSEKVSIDETGSLTKNYESREDSTTGYVVLGIVFIVAALSAIAGKKSQK